MLDVTRNWVTSIFPIAGPATLPSPVMAYRISATRSASTSPRDITGLVWRVRHHAGHQVALQMLGEADDLTAWNRLTFQKYPLRSFARLGAGIAISWKRWQDQRSQNLMSASR